MVIMSSVEKNIAREHAQPGLMALSPAFMFRLIPVPRDTQNGNVNPSDSTFITLPYTEQADFEILMFISEWNMLWEAGWARAEILDFPPQLNWLKSFAGERIQLLLKPFDGVPVHWLALYHLLPIDIRRKHKLPLIRSGRWPIMAPFALNAERRHMQVQNLRSAFAEFI